MKGWKKGLLVFSAIVGCLLTGISIKANAEDAFPQVTLNYTNGDILKDTSNREYTISISQKDVLSSDDFEEEDTCVDETTLYMAKNFGEIVFTLKEGYDTNDLNKTDSLKRLQIKGKTLDNLATISSGGTLITNEDTLWDEWTDDCAENYGDNGEGNYLIGPSTGKLGTNDRYLLVCFTDSAGKKYAVQYKYKLVLPPEYIVSQNSSGTRNIIDIAGANWSNRDYTVSLDGDTYIITSFKGRYDEKFAKDISFTPRYACGAKGKGADSNGKFTTTNKQHLSETGFPFTVTNINNEEKIFHLKVSMAWLLNYEKVRDQIKEVYAGEERQTPNTTNTACDTIPANSQVTVLLNVPENQKLSEVSLVDSENNPVSVEIGTEGESFSYTQPSSAVTVNSMTFTAKVTVTYDINTSTAVKDHEETASGCSVLVQKNGEAVSTAEKDAEITFIATTGTSENAHNYVFDHWETDDFSLTADEKVNAQITVTMPEHEVSIKAVYRHSGTEMTLGVSETNAAQLSVITGVASENFEVNSNKFTDYYKAKTYNISFKNLSSAYNFVGWYDVADQKYDTSVNTETITWRKSTINGTILPIPTVTLTENGAPVTLIAKFESRVGCTVNFNANDVSMGSVVATVEDKEIKTGTILYSGQKIKLKAVPLTGYKFKQWIVSEPADSGIVFEDDTKTETIVEIPAKTGITIQGVFEVDPEYLNPDCDLTKVELLKQDGTLVKQANRSGITFTIRLSADDMTAEEARNIASGQYLLRLTYPETATAEMAGGMKDGDSGTALWRTGISNSIGIGGSGTFTITAKRSEFKNTYTIAIEYDDRPVLKAGTVKRISDTEASVGFRSSSAGTYYWAVVDAGEAKPDIPTNGAGTTFKYADRENTIKLTSLTAGAKDLYIVVKNDDDSTNVKISDALKISIPAFGGAETTYKVNVTGSLPGGKLTVDKKEAKAGETVIVTVTPDSGKKMTTNSLIYSQSSAPYEVVHIDEKTKQFIMPAYELSVSCRFEDENSSTTPETTTGKIGAFVVNGVSGTVDNTTGTITVTLPNGTDLTSLAPVITISGAKSISPASGATVNLSSPVTYTLTLEDGTTKTYTVRAYVEGPSKSDQLWNDMLNNVDGSPDHSGSKTWWKKAKDLKKHNDYPEYW